MVLGLLELLLVASVPVLLVVGLLRQRKSASPGEVLLVYGRRADRRGYSIVRGTTLVMPALEAAEPFSLAPLSLALPDESSAIVRFPSDDEALSRCLDRLGVRPRSEIAELATDALRGALARASDLEGALHEARDALETLGLELESLSLSPSRAEPPRA